MIPNMFKKECIMNFFNELPDAIVFDKEYNIGDYNHLVLPISYISRKEKRKDAFQK